jgi:hypothetical protein
MLEKSKSLIIVLSSIAIIGCSTQSTPGFSGSSASPASPQKRARVSVDVFYDALRPYGDWFSMDRYGWVWMPNGVSVSWRPYTVGQWIYTDDGSTWDSDEPWGWATYHYGRWLYDANRGWVWVPGEEWAPAWVSWRYGGGYLGWAPLPPVVGWDDGTGLILGGLDIDEYIPPFWYSFVDERFFFNQRVRDHLVLSARNDNLVRLTRNVTSYTVADHRVFNRAIDVDRFEKDTGQTIRRYSIVDADSQQAGRRAGAKDGQIAFYRPDVSGDTREHAPRPLPSNLPAQTTQQQPDATDKRQEKAMRKLERQQQATQQPAVTDDMLKQQEKEMRDLERQHRANTDALKQLHQQELARPPAGISPDELGSRHEAERRALQDQHTREKQLLDNWHRMGRVGGSGPGRPKR